MDLGEEEKGFVESSGSQLLFNRKFVNPDNATCWLNSSLQLVLLSLDYSTTANENIFTLNLGRELLKLKDDQGQFHDASIVKDIIIAAEDTRIATRLSEESCRIIDKNLLRKQHEYVRNTS